MLSLQLTASQFFRVMQCAVLTFERVDSISCDAD